MGALIDLERERSKRRVPVAIVHYDDDRAARFYGEAYRRQRLYFWSRAEAYAFAAKVSGEVEPV